MKRTALAVLLFLAPAAVFAALPQITDTATVTATNGYTANGDGTITVVNQVQTAIPTLSSLGLAAFTLLLLAVAFYRLRRQARRAA
jgi:hypothetical protein